MRFFRILGWFWLVYVVVWASRLLTGMEHLNPDDLPAMIIGGVCGGLGAWYFRDRGVKKAAVE